MITWVTHNAEDGHPVYVGMSEIEQEGSDEMFFWTVIPYMVDADERTRELFAVMATAGLVDDEAVDLDPFESPVEAKAWCQLKENALMAKYMVPLPPDEEDDDEDDESYHRVG